ncbi:PAS domain-containing protein [Caenimonas sedimenti]|uniref:PAS domain-containing protein n=1 Tax=Caenimonas sedimenti TaxID=2596921 RepID=A0A562ZNG7_9BURK|nr:PAS domain-containing protein [Caenimonas sedimenti]TWO70083.1 PAS domain-containing protein [Caenimonas sedimenti]
MILDAKKMVFKEAAQVRLGLNLVSAELQQAQADLESAVEELSNRKAVELAGVIEATAQAMLIVDGDLLVRAANAQCHRILGYSDGALIGRAFRELVELQGEERDGSGQDATGTRADGERILLRVRTSIFGFGSARFMAATLENRS